MYTVQIIGLSYLVVIYFVLFWLFKLVYHLKYYEPLMLVGFARFCRTNPLDACVPYSAWKPKEPRYRCVLINMHRIASIQLLTRLTPTRCSRSLPPWADDARAPVSLWRVFRPALRAHTAPPARTRVHERRHRNARWNQQTNAF